MGDVDSLNDLIKPTKISGLFLDSIVYDIPIFQRSYMWSAKGNDSQVDKLWSDIKGCYNDDSSHYLGAIMVIPMEIKTAGIVDFMLIDGQQRLITLSILFRVIYEFLPEGEKKDECRKLLLSKNGQMKISRSDKDYKHYDLIMGNIDESYEGNYYCSDLTYNYFYGKVSKLCKEEDGFSSVEKLFDVVKEKLKVVFINIKMDGEEDPSFIFECINNTGIKLSPVSMIRNYLMMKCVQRNDVETKRLQNEVYSEIWAPLESLFNKEESKLADYLRVYLMMYRVNVPYSNLYPIAKEWINSKLDECTNGLSVKDALKSIFEPIYNSVKNYQYIMGNDSYPVPNGSKACIRIRYSLKMIQACDFKTHRSYLLKLMNYYDSSCTTNQKTKKKELSEMIAKVESYIVRRTLCQNMLNNTVDRMFSRLCVNNVFSMDALTEELLKMKDAGIWPLDSELEIALKEKNFYSKDRARLCIEVFRRIEYRGMNELEYVSESSADSIEHIFPQNWKAVEGEYDNNELDRMKERLDNLGNLALLGLSGNGIASDSPFSKKRLVYRDSSYTLTKDLNRNRKWSWQKIDKRRKLLTEYILHYWPRS